MCDGEEGGEMLDQREYLGDFWIPSNDNTQTPQKMSGRLKFVEGAFLELSDVNGMRLMLKCKDVLCGSLFHNIPVSLLGIRFKQLIDNGLMVFSIGYILDGLHVSSLETPIFNECNVKYPYLHHWASTNKISLHKEANTSSIVIDKTYSNTPIVESKLETGEYVKILENFTIREFPYKKEVEQSSYLKFQTKGNVSVKHFLELIGEFTHFFAIAQYFQQYPTEALFRGKGIEAPLYFFFGHSDKPCPDALIQFPELKEKIPEMMRRWHSNYQQISPICRHLLQFSGYDDFDFPDFLIFAQALDGYCKRFSNNDSESKHLYYKEQIDKLLKVFRDVDVIKNLNIDSEVLRQTRNKYSHLIPDDDIDITKAASGQELYDLTIKCKVLLTCCILDFLGLSIEEINYCCQNSTILLLVDSFQYYWKKYNLE